MSDTQLERKPTKRPERAKSTSQPQKHADYSPPDVHRVEDFGEAAWAGSAESSIKDLIQFFRKTPPPPTNFMSIPDNFNGSSEEDKWDKFKTKVFRRPSKKTRRKRPPVITLPDSAVASRTTDGHRYIAISIPMEYSPLELQPSQGPIFGSLEAEFQRDVNSKLGTWKISPANRLVTVLNPVPEDLRESLSSSSPLSVTLEQPDQLTTALSAPSMRKRAHTIPLSPGQEQRYAPEKVKEPARYRSVSDPQTATAPSTRPQSSEEKHAPLSATTEKSGSGSTKKNVSPITSPKEIDTAEPSPGRLPEKPVITLTLPRRKSSLRGSQLKPAPPETTENLTSARQGSASDTNSNGNGHKRGSFAASIDTTSSSPQLLKATTAVVGQSIPVVVRPASADDDSPLDLNFPEPPSAKWKTDRLPRVSAVGPPQPISTGPERSQSRKERVRERKQRDTEKQRAQMEHKGKGKEPSHSLGFIPGIPAAIPGMLPSAILGYRHHHQEREDSDSDSPSPTESSVSSHIRGLAETVPSPLSQKEKREEREARYVAKALAEERETLEHLPREELIQRYEKLREQRIYERERRLRKLERSRDTWIRAVPVLLQDLNSLLRQQHRILEGAGLTYGFLTPAGSSQHHHGHHHHLRHMRRRSRSLEVSSSSSPLSDPDPLETRRSRSLHSSGESRREHRSSKVTPRLGKE